MGARFLLNIVVLLACAACGKKTVEWPIPELTIPSSAYPGHIPEGLLRAQDRQYLNADGDALKTGPNIRSWIKGFNYSPGWDSLVKHVEKELLPIGYTTYSEGPFAKIPDMPGVPKGKLMRAYISPDRVYVVALINVALLQTRDRTLAGAQFMLGIDEQQEATKPKVSASASTKGWPVPGLTLPDSAVLAPIPVALLKGDASDLPENKRMSISPKGKRLNWAKGFNANSSWGEVVHHVRGCIEPLGYTDAMSKFAHILQDYPGLKREEYVRIYESPEGRYKVQLINAKALRDNGHTTGMGGADYVLIVGPPGLN